MVPTFNQLAGEDGSSVSLAFKKQLDDLKTELESSACHFVRCLKCNRSKVSATESCFWGLCVAVLRDVASWAGGGRVRVRPHPGAAQVHGHARHASHPRPGLPQAAARRGDPHALHCCCPPRVHVCLRTLARSARCWGLQDFVSGYRFMDKNASTPEALVSAIEQILPDLVAANKVRTLSLPMHPL